ncbi:Aorsin [Pseudocercospora fuligena]|uniref:tripeptidyl-peptidase II n=1 Tax=Pseudocercospora fuligena TaxID=685502 RepID=A0A8H6VPC2_9PEZI|nr:Aorsin [Pseudocercospora fuligena]
MWKYLLCLSTLHLAINARNVLHEKRSSSSSGAWKRSQRVDKNAIVPLRIGLKQHNLASGEERLLAISDSLSGEYGKYMSREEVDELFAPSHDTVSAVRAWLIDHGINETVVAHSDSKGWIAANIPAGDAESLLSSELYEYEHMSNGKIRMGCDQYHVPTHLTKHIDYITPGVKMSAILQKRDLSKGEGWSPHHGRGPQPHPNPTWHYPMPPAASGLPPELANCGVNITPPCWRALYGLPVGHINDSVNTLGLYEQGDYFSQSDISKYFAMYSPNVPSNTSPQVVSVDGGEAPVAASDPGNSGESDIDLDIVISLVYSQSIIVYQVDDANYAPKEVAVDNTFNTFLDALDGSYCNYTAYGITGNSPSIDPTYPDSASNGYKGQLQCGAYKPTRVISASYGESEKDFPKNYVLCQCNEFMKLGLQGHTIFVSSSDYGVGNAPGDPTASGCLSGNGQNQTIYNPDYPSGCPWITTVGATQLYPNQTVLDKESAMQVDLWRPGRPNAYHFFATAGGFSNYFSTASYQRSAVDEYFAKHDPGHPYYTVNANATNIGAGGGIYNRAGRGYPDVSANGAYMPVFINGTLGKFFGTSLASPIWASVITLVNQQRTIAGKGPVGFINPTLYANPWVLNDIVNGSNPNCGSSGFKAVEGWDPTTGLGTPNYPKMLKLFMGLP